jgi:hypothetical protein
LFFLSRVTEQALHVQEVLYDEQILDLVHEVVQLFLVVLVEKISRFYSQIVDQTHPRDVVAHMFGAKERFHFLQLGLECLRAHDGRQMVREGHLVNFKKLHELDWKHFFS